LLAFFTAHHTRLNSPPLHPPLSSSAPASLPHPPAPLFDSAPASARPSRAAPPPNGALPAARRPPPAESPLKDRFALTARVGSGAYGEVWLATRGSDPTQKFSVKQSAIRGDGPAVASSVFRPPSSASSRS
jgi:hypothetical protein